MNKVDEDILNSTEIVPYEEFNSLSDGELKAKIEEMLVDKMGDVVCATNPALSANNPGNPPSPPHTSCCVGVGCTYPPVAIDESV